MSVDEYFCDLVRTLHKFRETDFLCDTVLVCDDQRQFRAHSVVLAAASSVFHTAFKSAANSGSGPLQVNLRDYDGDIVEIALQFIYTGHLANIPESFYGSSQWIRLVAALERLGLDAKLISNCSQQVEQYAFRIILC